ncbi:MAG: BON domain-containing protein [Alphaproteobacteria bacterium]|nr:BON domain-containing protein [Alphaproteobacteria bacterium]
MRTLILTTALALATPVLAPTALAADDDASVFEETLRHARVRWELVQHLGLDGLEVTIEVDGGTVTLLGEVARETRKLAPTLAKTVDGVDAVRNKLRVEEADKDGDAVAEAFTDGATHAAVRVRLLEAIGPDALDLKVRVAGDAVALAGQVDSAEHRRQAVAAAKEVERIDRVLDELTLAD